LAGFVLGPLAREEIAMALHFRRIGGSVRGWLALVGLLSFGSFTPPATARDKHTVVVDGVTRTYLVDPGKDAATTPSPLVFVFHGSTLTALDAANLGIAKAWPEATVVYPQGVNYYGGSGWQDWWGEFADQDVRFVDAMFADLTTAYRVDPRRVYATGESNGGSFTWVLLAARPERFAAFAAVIYPDRENLAWASVPRPALYMNGDQDVENNPADWAEWTRDRLLRLNGCGAGSSEWMPGVILSQPCASGQPVLYARFHGGHNWPKTATPAVVSFFQGQALPADPPAAVPAAGGSAGEIVAGVGTHADFLVPGTAGDGGLARLAQLSWPSDVIVGPAGNLLLIADTWNHRIRQVNRFGIITTVAGTNVPGFNWAPRQEGDFSVFLPKALTVDRAGNLYVADDVQRRVIRIGTDGAIRAVAGVVPKGQNGIRFSGDDGPADQAELSFPYGLAVDADGNLFLSDTANHRVRKVGLDGIIHTVAGTGTPGFSGDSGPALQARLYQPWGLAIDREGRLLIADAGNHCIRRVSRDGTITTVAGNGTEGFDGDSGPAVAARLSFPAHLAVDSLGNVFIADTPSHRIRRVAPDGTITTLVGEGGTATSVPVGTPEGMAIDRVGNLYVADPTRHVIRKFAAVAAPGLVAGAPLP
jgi:poly(3-hydroxybutyrate) depolymerase/sugar lactone lactonase YvrE